MFYGNVPPDFDVCRSRRRVDDGNRQLPSVPDIFRLIAPFSRRSFEDAPQDRFVDGLVLNDLDQVPIVIRAG